MLRATTTPLSTSVRAPSGCDCCPPFAIRATRLLDRDRDTKVDTDEGFADEDKIRFDTGGTERAVLDSTGFDLKSGEYKLAGKAVGWQLIESQTASNSSSLDFTTGIDSDHDLYMFVLSIVVPATGGANLRLRVSEDGGTTWKNGSADYEWHSSMIPSTNANYAAHRSQGDANIRLSDSVGNASGEGLSGYINSYTPAASVSHLFTGHVVCLDNASPAVLKGSRVFATYNGSTNAIDGVQFFFSGGRNISSGTIALYGLAK